MDLSFIWITKDKSVLRPVLEIEKQNFDMPWSYENFCEALADDMILGMVVKFEGEVIGYIIYELLEKELHVINFSIDPKYHRCGIGSQLLQLVINKTIDGPREIMTIIVKETNLPCQLLLRKLGFKAVETLKSYYDDVREDGYLFERKMVSLEPLLPK